jgi:S1-C subfamily serine protease
VPENNQDTLTQLSTALSARVASARALVAGIRSGGRPLRSGTLWRKDVVVASEQALPDIEEAQVSLTDGGSFTARMAGRDPGTNIAVLKLDGTPAPAPITAAEPLPGALALALGAEASGGVSVRLGTVHSVGPAWHSRAGGRIDYRIMLDFRLGGREEGGPVLDAAGGLLGISTLGPRGRVLVIPAATVERVLEPLLTTGRIERGWLGAAVQPVLVPEALRGEAGQALGLMIIGVTPDGPAAKAGVLMGDILIGVDGAGVTSPAQLATLLGSESVGRQVQLRLIRAGQVQSVAATVGARPMR